MKPTLWVNGQPDPDQVKMDELGEYLDQKDAEVLAGYMNPDCLDSSDDFQEDYND